MVEQTELPLLEGILKEDMERRAQTLVDNINNGFFEAVAQGLTDGQKLTFEFPDGTRHVMTNKGCVRVENDIYPENFVDERGRHCCSECGRSIEKMKVFFNKIHVLTAIKAFEYAVKNNIQFVHIKDIGLTPVEYSVMNKLVKFGLAYRDENILIHGSNIGVYGIPRKRISDFIQGNWKVAEHFIQDPLMSEGKKGKREMSEKRISIHEVPSIAKLRAALGDHLTEYVWTDEDSFE